MNEWRSEKVWRCWCGSEYLTVSALNWGTASEPDWQGCVSVEALYASPDGWCDRLKAAWHMLTGRSVCEAEVLLDAETAREVARELLKAAETIDGQKYVLLHLQPGALEAVANQTDDYD